VARIGRWGPFTADGSAVKPAARDESPTARRGLALDREHRRPTGVGGRRDHQRPARRGAETAGPRTLRRHRAAGRVLGLAGDGNWAANSASAQRPRSLQNPARVLGWHRQVHYRRENC